MEIIRGLITLTVFIAIIICIILQVKRCRKTYYNMFNLHIITAIGSVFCIGGGCGLMVTLFSSANYQNNSAFANSIFTYACIGFIIFGLMLCVFNIYNGYKGLNSVFFAFVNLIIQALVGFLCLFTCGIGFIFVYLFYKKTIGDLK